MTRKEYDQILDVFSMVSPSLELGRDKNWKEYEEDEPKDFVVEMSVRLMTAVLSQGVEVEIENGSRNPLTDRDRLSQFAPEELN
jgi:hypothetical protein